MDSVPGLLGHTKAKGTDICGSKSSLYIIRSDLGCYMEINKQFDKLQRLTIHPLHPSCAGGDHYLNDGDKFYIIRGDSFFAVPHLSFPEGTINVKALHESCRNGDHYLFADTSFFIIYEDTGTYSAVYDLSTGKQSLPSGEIDRSNHGIYYFGLPFNFYPRSHPIYKVSNPDSVYQEKFDNWREKNPLQDIFNYRRKFCIFGVIHQLSENGMLFYTETKYLQSQGDKRILFPDIVNFLPGGLSTTFGPADSAWKLVHSFTNKTTAELKWSKAISKTVGYHKKRLQSIEKSWNASSTFSMGSEVGATIEGLLKASVKNQFSLSESFGGKSINLEEEDWNEQCKIEEKIELDIPPGGSVYMWQFTLGFKGLGKVLSCQDLQLTSSAEPPQDIPFRKIRDQEQ